LNSRYSFIRLLTSIITRNNKEYLVIRYLFAWLSGKEIDNRINLQDIKGLREIEVKSSS
jgi:hypothetical protein